MKGRLAAALSLLVLLAPVARASVEEFSTFDLAPLEQDDENFLDHWLTRVPLRWDDEYRAATGAFRTSQGCYTSGEWFMKNDFKVRAALGRKTYLDLVYTRMDDDVATWEWMRFDFRFATDHTGTFGFRFQPSHDKSQHDFALLWDGGVPNGPLEVNATFTLEDAFNSLWEFRQARVGESYSPYRAHPVEPALRIASHGAHHRFELNGKWLTPLRQDHLQDPDTTLNGTHTLWGSKGSMLASVDVGRWTLEGRFEDEQVRSSHTRPSLAGDDRRLQRRWQAEAALQRSLGGTWRSELRWAYQDRMEDWRPPPTLANMRALDRGLAFEISGQPREDWHLRVGYLHDRILIAEHGTVPAFTWGTRKESRAYIGLEALFGRVRVQGIEGIELDQEPYDVTWHHDKGFLQLQTTF